MIIGFTVAMLLDQVSRFTRGIYLSIFLLPFIIVPIVGTLMFKQLFEPSGSLYLPLPDSSRYQISLQRGDG